MLKMRILTPLAGLGMLAMATASCGTLIGAGVGAGAGAAIAKGTDKDVGKGALIGAGVGGVAGAVYDVYKRR